MPNNFRRGLAPSRPPSDPLMLWPQPVPYQNQPPDDRMMLGLIFERSTATAEAVSGMREDIGEIKERLIRGDNRFENLEERMTVVEKAQPKPSTNSAPSSLLQMWAPAVVKSALGALFLLLATASVIPWDVAKPLAFKMFGTK